MGEAEKVNELTPSAIRARRGQSCFPRRQMFNASYASRLCGSAFSLLTLELVSRKEITNSDRLIHKCIDAENRRRQIFPCSTVRELKPEIGDRSGRSSWFVFCRNVCHESLKPM